MTDILMAIWLIGWALLAVASYVDWRRGNWTGDDWWLAVLLGWMWPAGVLIPFVMLNDERLARKYTRERNRRSAEIATGVLGDSEGAQVEVHEHRDPYRVHILANGAGLVAMREALPMAEPDPFSPSLSRFGGVDIYVDECPCERSSEDR